MGGWGDMWGAEGDMGGWGVWGPLGDIGGHVGTPGGGARWGLSPSPETQSCMLSASNTLHSSVQRVSAVGMEDSVPAGGGAWQGGVVSTEPRPPGLWPRPFASSPLTLMPLLSEATPPGLWPRPFASSSAPNPSAPEPDPHSGHAHRPHPPWPRPHPIHSFAIHFPHLFLLTPPPILATPTDHTHHGHAPTPFILLPSISHPFPS